ATRRPARSRRGPSGRCGWAPATRRRRRRARRWARRRTCRRGRRWAGSAGGGPAATALPRGRRRVTPLAGRPPPPRPAACTPEALGQAGRGEVPWAGQVTRAVPAALEAVCAKAMAARRAERYASAKLLAREVERWLADEPVGAHREPITVRAGRWMRRHRPLV